MVRLHTPEARRRSTGGVDRSSHESDRWPTAPPPLGAASARTPARRRDGRSYVTGDHTPEEDPVSDDPTARGVHQRSDHPVYVELNDSPEFVELRKQLPRLRRPGDDRVHVVVPALRRDVDVGARLHEHQGRRQRQRGPVFGLLQFVSTFLIAWLYGRYMNTERRPARARAQAPLRRRARRRRKEPPMSSETLSTILFLVVVADHDRDHLLGQPATPRARPTSTPAAARSAASRTAWPSAATTCPPRRSSASPARSRWPGTTASSTRSASSWPGWWPCCSSPSCCGTPAATRWPTSSPTG